MIPHEQFKIACRQRGSEIVTRREDWDANVAKAIAYIEESFIYLAEASLSLSHFFADFAPSPERLPANKPPTVKSSSRSGQWM